VDLAMLREVAWAPSDQPLCYVCGPAGFVELVAGALAELGHAPERIRTERFGPSAGA
jgi:ferredoxin-NADP reductase